MKFIPGCVFLKMDRKYFLLFAACLLSVFSFAQSRSLTEKEKSWIDSLNTIYGKKNPWFDSLMKADGKCMRVQSREHFMNGDTARDILSYYRQLHPDGPRPSDSPSKVSFDFYPAKNKIIADYGPEIYLRASGALIVEFSYGIWGQGRTGMIIRQEKDTVFNSRKQNADTTLAGFDNPSKKIILAGMDINHPVIATIIIGEKLNAGKAVARQQIVLAECRMLAAEYPTNAITYPPFRKTFIASFPDSLFLKHQKGDTLFVEIDSRYANDTVRKISYAYFKIKREFSFKPEAIERTIIYNRNASSPVTLIYLSKEERRDYNRFVKRNPKKNDPSGIYYDPVYRWMYKKRR